MRPAKVEINRETNAKLDTYTGLTSPAERCQRYCPSPLGTAKAFVGRKKSLCLSQSGHSCVLCRQQFCFANFLPLFLLIQKM